MKQKGFSAKREVKGFTLIEILVVMSIMAVLGLIFTNTLVQTLRNQNKVRVVNQVKQNGQVGLDRISNEIRQAERVFCINDNQANTDTLILFRQGVYTRIRFAAPSPANNPTANGYISIDYPDAANADCNGAQSLPQSLTDQDTKNGVSIDFNPLTAGFPKLRDPLVSDKIFTKNSLPGYPDTINIKFRATSGVSAGRMFENLVSDNGVLFDTTVEVRGGRM